MTTEVRLDGGCEGDLGQQSVSHATLFSQYRINSSL